MKRILCLITILLSFSAMAKIAKANVGGDLNFKFEMPKKEIQRSLASKDKKAVKAKKTAVEKKQRDPASQDDVDNKIQRNGIQFWKF